MKKSELKELIKECIKEGGSIPPMRTSDDNIEDIVNQLKWWKKQDDYMYQKAKKAILAIFV